MTAPSCSIVVPSMGRPDLLGSLLAGIYFTGFGVQVCIGFDPAGGKPLPWLIDDWQDKFDYRQAIPDRPGMSSALNAAVSLASNDWIIILSDDMVPLDGWLELPEISPDRILCFSLLEPGFGSFPPPVDAGRSPAEFDSERAERAAEERYAEHDRMAVPGRFFVGACILHRSKWVDWPTHADPYSMNDIAWMWETHLAHPEAAFGRMPGNCVYHFQSASVREAGIRAPEDTAMRFWARYGLSIEDAYHHIYRHSEGTWNRSAGS